MYSERGGDCCGGRINKDFIKDIVFRQGLEKVKKLLMEGGEKFSIL